MASLSWGVKSVPSILGLREDICADYRNQMTESEMDRQSVAEDRQLNGVKNKGPGRKGKGKERTKGNDEGFVDIIAAGGQEWIRIYRSAYRCCRCYGEELTR